jgi:PBP1b-binding outer membrane lipoprotein LpoB
MPKFWILLCTLLLAGCASNGTQPDAATTPKIERISADDLQLLMPAPVVSLSLDDIVALSLAGISPQDIISQLKENRAFFDLTPSQAIELNRRGLDLSVLDYLHQATAAAVRDSMADEINRRAEVCREQQKELEARVLQQSWGYCDPHRWPYPSLRLQPYPGGYYYGW